LRRISQRQLPLQKAVTEGGQKNLTGLGRRGTLTGNAVKRGPCRKESGKPGWGGSKKTKQKKKKKTAKKINGGVEMECRTKNRKKKNKGRGQNKGGTEKKKNVSGRMG